MTRELAICVDLGGTNVRVGLGDDQGRILAKLTEETEKKKGPEGISEQIVRMIHSIQPEAGEIQGIGIGSTGPLDPDKGGLMKPAKIPYDFVPLVEPLTDEFDLPIYLLNDCTSAVVGEKFFGAGKNHENLAYVTISTGIGGGVYVDGHLLMGKDRNAAEIGHFTIDHEGALPCGCGKRGHWQAYCSGKGIPNYVKLLLKEKKREDLQGCVVSDAIGGDRGEITAKTLFDAAKAGDPISKDLVGKIGVLNAIGFACVVDAYDPSLITVGGAITSNNTGLVIDPITRHVQEHTRNRVPEIIITPLGEDIVLYGALATVFHHSEVLKQPPNS
ncbi:MAG: ROK family protein [Candidatus Bathyarchaeota archaeon]|nr:ROK family protein [Candidatus Bathyarchaeota archaeon]MDH5686371.1 ROK family protein [Candidatus Bathyarchaeota archaeon]